LENVGTKPAAPAPGSFQITKGGPILNIKNFPAAEREENPAVALTRAGALGLASGFTGMPETTSPLREFGANVKREQEEFMAHPLREAATRAFIPPSVSIGGGLLGSVVDLGRGLGASLHLIPRREQDPFVGPERVAHAGGQFVG